MLSPTPACKLTPLSPTDYPFFARANKQSQHAEKTQAKRAQRFSISHCHHSARSLSPSFLLQGLMFAENWITDVARVCGLEQHTVRERNFYGEGDETFFGQVLRSNQVNTHVYHGAHSHTFTYHFLSRTHSHKNMPHSPFPHPVSPTALPTHPSVHPSTTHLSNHLLTHPSTPLITTHTPARARVG
jgi:hypothetical protein